MSGFVWKVERDWRWPLVIIDVPDPVDPPKFVAHVLQRGSRAEEIIIADTVKKRFLTINTIPTCEPKSAQLKLNKFFFGSTSTINGREKY